MVYAVTEGSLLEIPEGPLGKLIAGNDAFRSDVFLFQVNGGTSLGSLLSQCSSAYSVL